MGVRDPIASLLLSVTDPAATADISASSTSFGYDPLKRARIAWGDGDFADVVVPFTSYSHAYQRAGTYRVAVEVFTAQGRSDKADSDAAIASGALDQGSTLIHQASRTLSHAEILAANSDGSSPSYPTVIPAPGANRFIVVDQGWQDQQLAVIYGNVYGGVNDVLKYSMHLAYGDDLENASAYLTLSSLDQIANRLTPIAGMQLPTDRIFALGTGVEHGYVITQTAHPNVYVNQPITWIIYNNPGDLTGGNAANFIVVCLLFLVYDRTQKKFLTTSESGWNESTRTFAS